MATNPTLHNSSHTTSPIIGGSNQAELTLNARKNGTEAKKQLRKTLQKIGMVAALIILIIGVFIIWNTQWRKPATEIATVTQQAIGANTSKPRTIIIHAPTKPNWSPEIQAPIGGCVQVVSDNTVIWMMLISGKWTEFDPKNPPRNVVTAWKVQSTQANEVAIKLIEHARCP